VGREPIGGAISRSDSWRGLLADLERSATARGRESLGCFSIEGTRVHERLLNAGRRPEAVLLSRAYRHSTAERAQRLILRLEESGCSIQVAPDETLSELTGGRDIGAVVGLVRLSSAPPLAEVLARPGTTPTLLLVLVDVEDPGNVGALVRTGLASGVAGIVAVGISDPYHPRAVRTSMGSLFKLPIVLRPALASLLEEFRKAGVVTLAAVSSGGQPLTRFRLQDDRAAVCVGNEAFGLAAEAVCAMDRRLTVPMASPIDSLSVNAAAAVVLYELRRGR